MTTETFEFNKCSRWALAQKLFGVFWSRKMAVAYEPTPAKVEETITRKVEAVS